MHFIKEIVEEGLDVEESQNLCEYVLDSDYRPFPFIPEYDDDEFLQQRDEYLEQLQVQDKGSFIDVEGDGNCGYNSLIVGLYIKNIDANSEIVDNIMLDKNPTAKV